MKREQDISASERHQISEILDRHLTELWSDVQNKINQHVMATKTELNKNKLQLSDAEPANDQYFSAYVLEKLFASLHEDNQEIAETIIYNLKGQAGILK